MSGRKRAWSGYSLQTQFILAGLGVTLVFLVLVEALSLGFLGAIIGNIGSTANDALSTQLTQALTANVNDAASLFENDLNKTARSISLLLSRAAGDTFRTDQPFGVVASFFDSPLGIAAAGPTTPAQGSRFAGSTITLQHSTYSVPNAAGNSAPSLPADQQAIVDATAHLDPIFRSSYQLNTNTILLYLGFDNGGVYRRYPGTGDSRNLTGYDPRLRPWFKDAKAYPASPYVVTDPYPDFFGQGWEITVSSLIRNTSSGTVIGVAGVDIRIGTLKSMLEAQAVKGSTMSLYHTAGFALSSPSWNWTTYTDTLPFTYKNASNPTISTDLWQRMTSARPGLPTSEVYKDPGSSESYLLVYKVFTITDGKSTPSYISLSCFPMSLVNVPVQNVQSRMQNLLATYSGISVGIFFAVLIIVATSVAILANAAAQPLVRLSQESEKISRNMGESDLFAGVGSNISKSKGLAQVKETEELSDRFYSMVETLRAASKVGVDGKNPFYRNLALPVWDAASQPQKVVSEVPDLPPTYDTTLAPSAEAAPA